jgi:hypothetical protein
VRGYMVLETDRAELVVAATIDSDGISHWAGEAG